VLRRFALAVLALVALFATPLSARATTICPMAMARAGESGVACCCDHSSAAERLDRCCGATRQDAATATSPAAPSVSIHVAERPAFFLPDLAPVPEAVHERVLPAPADPALARTPSTPRFLLVRTLLI
jgi:hypothetical protein